MATITLTVLAFIGMIAVLVGVISGLVIKALAVILLLAVAIKSYFEAK